MTTVVFFATAGAKIFRRNIVRMTNQGATLHEITDYISYCKSEGNRARYAKYVEVYKSKYNLE